MHSELITKMTNYFSKKGSIIYSKACDYSGLYKITIKEINEYYKLLTSDKVTISLPQEVSKNNHIACCLFYLTKEKEDYKEVFLDKFVRIDSLNNLPIIEENLIYIFNIIEFDKSYLNSSKNHIRFLFNLLKRFSNYQTIFESYLLYRYFKGYLKFRLEEYENANNEYYGIFSDLCENKSQNFTLIKYILLKNSLLKVNLFHIAKKTKADYQEYWQFLKDLFNEVKTINKILALKLGMHLFSTYFEGNKYDSCIPLLLEIEEILKGVKMKNGNDYYLAIASRLGYMGLLLDNQEAVNSAIKEIQISLDIIKKDENNPKLKELENAYNLVLAILEIALTKRTDFEMMPLATDFQKIFFPDLNFNTNLNYIINKKNKESVIINLKIINSMNEEIANVAKNILNKCVNEIENENYSNPLFFICIMAVHDKINSYSNFYITDKNEEYRVLYKKKLLVIIKE